METDQVVDTDAIIAKALQDPYQVLQETGKKLSLYEFILMFWSEVSEDTFRDNWHVKFLCGHLSDMALRVAKNLPKKHDLVINIPPGTTKTIICSIMFPAWCWARGWYWMRFITASYSAQLALESAEKSRDLIKSDKFMKMYPDLIIKDDKDTKSNFRIAKKIRTGSRVRLRHGGNRFSTSVGGSLTGFHGHIIIIDDPLNPDQAASEKELINCNRWMEQTLPTRKTDKEVSCMVLVMQRLHQNDPTGRILEKKKDKIKHICLPGQILHYKQFVKPVEALLKYKDNLLDPIRLSWTALGELLDDLGQYGFAGQIGQNPTPPGGGMFKPDHMPFLYTLSSELNIVKTVRYWDKAATEGGTGSFTAGVKMCVFRNGQFLILDVVRGRWDTNEREAIIKSTAINDGRNVFIGLEQEPGPIWEEELVQMGDGTRKKLKDVKKGDLVINHKGRSTEVLEVHVQGELDTLEIRTDSGRSVCAAYTHPFYTPNGWITAGELCEDDVLALKTDVQIIPQYKPTNEECRLAGYFVGDGCTTFTRRDGKLTKSFNANVVCSDPTQGEDITHCGESVGAKVHLGGSKGWTYHMSDGIRDWLRDHDLAGKSTDTKEVPDWVKSADKECVANFIGAFLAADGSVMDKIKHPAIEFYNTNLPLLKEIQSLLLRFGIYCMIRERKRRDTDHWKTRRRMFRITTRRSDDSMGKFAERIPVYGVKGKRLTFLRLAFDQEYLPDPIVEIIPSGKLPCRCLTVAEGDSFLVSDIAVHNSGGKDSAQATIRNLSGFSVMAECPTGDKVFRADPFSVQVNNGNVILMNGDWNTSFKEELEMFPNGTYKDQVDAASAAFNMLAGKKQVRVIR